MNDQVLMDNYLLVLKSTVEVYVHGTLESSNKDIRAMLKDNLNTILGCQASTYDLMSRYGWYPTTNVDTNQITSTIDKIKNS